MDKNTENEEDNTTDYPTEVIRNNLANKTPLYPTLSDEKRTDFVIDEQAVTLVSFEPRVNQDQTAL